MSSRIEQIIEEIEEYVDSCKYQPLSTTKIVVNKEEIEELLRELRLKTPDEIKRYQKIISNKDAILEDAQTKADAHAPPQTASKKLFLIFFSLNFWIVTSLICSAEAVQSALRH